MATFKWRHCALANIVFYCWLVGCQSVSETVSEAATDTLSVGYTLSQQYCANCHLYPEPDLLPRDTWQAYVLPRMDHRLGIFPHDSVQQSLLENGVGGQRVAQAGFVYLQNQGGNSFGASTFQESTAGRWLVMDLNGDGDIDLVLGSFASKKFLPLGC